MVDEPYDMLPHKEIVELKKQLKELKSSTGKKPSQELLNSMNTLTKSIDSLLKLFTKTAEELKHEEESPGNLKAIDEKLNEVIEQNKTIAEGVVAISDSVNDFIENQRSRPRQQSFYPRPGFSPPKAPEPMIQQTSPKFPEPQDQGPVPMPSMPFSDFGKKPKKKGLFGKFK